MQARNLGSMFAILGIINRYLASLLSANNLSEFFQRSPYPTAVQCSLPSGASFARFSPSGKYVASGRSDGGAVVWSLETKAAIRWLSGHVRAVTSIE